MITFEVLPEITRGEIISLANNHPIKNLLLDSRKISQPENSLFFAIKGMRHDGHQFLQEAYKKGVRQFVIEEKGFNKEELPDANILMVTSSIDALQALARYHREQYKIPVIGITGSNGKTIVKEWLSQVLIKDYFIVKNPKSYNSQVGVPLSIWEISDYHTLGVFEAGISLPGEMERIAKIIQPTIGIITNIGPAHDEGFLSREEKVAEKLKLFDGVEMLFYCSDYDLIESGIKRNLPAIPKFTWSRKNRNADLYIEKEEGGQEETMLHIIYAGRQHLFYCHFTDEASLENIIYCIVLMFYFGIEAEEIQKRILLLHAVGMRLELKEGINNCYLIDDTYNNDLAGLAIALDFLISQSKSKKKRVVLSDVLETGKEEEELYKSIAVLLKDRSISGLIGIGKKFEKYKRFFPTGVFYPSTEDFLRQLKYDDFNNELLLIKGARIFQFEKIVTSLQKKVHGTVLKINLDALAHNLNFYKSLLKPQTKVMVMVKAFAYGSGSYEVANLLQFHRADYLGVAYTDEGIRLRENGIALPIMVMNPSPESFSKIIEYNLEPEIYSMKILHELLNFLNQHNAKVKVHLKVDTGMRRLGFEEKELETLISKLQNERLEIVSIFTHLAASDEAFHSDFTLEQLQTFNRIYSRIEKKLGIKVIKHCLNSSGIVRYPEHQLDMVRLGIGLYGYESNKMKQSLLKEVGTLTTVISQIKEVKKGETVGYSRKGIMDRDSRIGTIAVGYADGYSRKLGNGVGSVIVKGVRCRTVGNICMDMTMVDVTDCSAKEGDEVIVFGKQMPVSEIAESIGTIPYEVLTGVSERVKRIFYTE